MKTRRMKKVQKISSTLVKKESNAFALNSFYNCFYSSFIDWSITSIFFKINSRSALSFSTLRFISVTKLLPLFGRTGRYIWPDQGVGERRHCRVRTAKCCRMVVAGRTQHTPSLSGSSDLNPRFDGACLWRAVRFLPADVWFPERALEFWFRIFETKGNMG